MHACAPPWRPKKKPPGRAVLRGSPGHCWASASPVRCRCKPLSLKVLGYGLCRPLGYLWGNFAHRQFYLRNSLAKPRQCAIICIARLHKADYQLKGE